MRHLLSNFDFRSKKGMTLAELLVGIAVSAVIMIATFTMVNYSFSSYSSTQSSIANDAGLNDATEIINRYIREAKFCSVKETNSNALYLASTTYNDSGIMDATRDMRIILDEESHTLVLDILLTNEPDLILARNIESVKWEVYNNSVRYEIVQRLPTSDKEETIYGFAYSRGR